MDESFGSVALVRLVVQRGLAAIYLLAFVSALNQFPALLGEQGLLPIGRYVARTRFSDGPSLFRLRYSDRSFSRVAWTGIALSLAALSGISESGSVWLSAAVWLALWVLYLSIVNVGQTFYGFGWESMLLEAGFFAIFLGPAAARTVARPDPRAPLHAVSCRARGGSHQAPPRRVLAKTHLPLLSSRNAAAPEPAEPDVPSPAEAPASIRRALQPLRPARRAVRTLLPSARGVRRGRPIVVHQLWLIVSGNYAWLNWLTIVLGVTAFDDSLLGRAIPFELEPMLPRSLPHDIVLYVLGAATLLLGIAPVKNLFSKHQRMNYSYNPLHLVNSYGAFGSVTKVRHEIILEGTLDETPAEDGDWKEYEFRAKPGRVDRRPPQVAPYHLRLDWLMWFLPFGVRTHGDRVLVPGHDRWFLRLVEKLLLADTRTLSLLKAAPFSGPPRFLRARYYRYQFADRETRNRTGAFWTRRLIGDYLPPTDLSDFRLSKLSGD